MLPDFPKLKQQYLELIDGHFRAAVNSDALISIIPSEYVFEGSKLQITDMTGYEETKPFEAFSEKVEIDVDKVITRGEFAYIEALERLGARLTNQLNEFAYNRFQEVADRVGNVIDAKGKGITENLILELFDTVELEFDDDDKPVFSNQTFVLHPDNHDVLKNKLENIENDPILKKRLNKIIERQKRRWHDRESNRKLVD